MDGGPKVVHATAIALGAEAALIRGPSGAGKSDLALRCLAMAPSASGLIGLTPQLVADDQVRLARAGLELRASAPDVIRGKIEVRGLGIVDLPSAPEARVVLVVDLVPPAEVERLPARRTVTILGIELPLLALAPFESSAPVKLLLALAQEAGHRLVAPG